MSAGARPFRIDIPDATLQRIRTRLAQAQWPDVPAGEPWAFGTDMGLMRQAVDHWLNAYDWRAQEAWLNRFEHFIARIDGIDIHFLHVRGEGEHPRPLLLCHGWPGSFVEFMDMVDPLTRPSAHGGRAQDAFSVVIPSLPGFGFSGKPPTTIGPRTIARLFDRLMTEVLGHTSGYIAHGGDWGSAVSSWLGFEGAGCRAVHLNMVMIWRQPGVKPQTPTEIEAMNANKAYWRDEGAYMAIQATKPLTLSYAMQDSPLGVAAWILEKFQRWSDLGGGDLWTVYGHDRLITNLMVYLVTDSFGSASWIYNGFYRDRVPEGAFVSRPTAVAHFPKEVGFLPRSMVARSYNVVRWTEMPRGGHFPGLEAPQLLVDDLRAFAREL